ncbi:hypothetical protein C0Q70_08412 [Pomacea canaliculata]|uniref:Uncharacterized protein n=1 Tax=Pomacea canaliculata TaxID=400727 RepID=A0A2T7PHS8_POMCA|nr:hypothetical protein C0Q70_08412 [Pomacea canaliculata]
MVSIVLEDVDGNVLDNEGSLDEDGLRRLPYHHESTPPDDLLCIPQSRSSSMSLSPVPLSPVTVIEVGLDNQQDSLDTEEGTGSSKDLSEPIDETEEERNDSDEFNREVDLLPREADTLGSETDPGEFPPNIEISLEQRLSSALPFSDTQSESGFEVVVPRKVREVSVAADDGKCSPIFLFGMVSSRVSSPSASSSFSPLSSRQRNIASQADDGKLSPLVKVHDERILEALVENFHGNGYYLVKDCGAQCTISEGMLDMSSEPDIVTTETEVFDSFTQTARLIRYEMSSQTTPVSSSHVHSFSQTDLNTECESRSVSPDFWEYLGLEIPIRLRGTFESENVSLLNVPQNSATADNLHVAYSPSLSASPCSIDFPLLDLPGRSSMARLVKPTARAQTACQTDQHLPENNPDKFSWTFESQPMSLLDVPGNCLRWMEDNLDDGYSRSLSGSPCSIDFPLLDLPGRSAMKRSDKPTIRVQTACQTNQSQPEVFETSERDSSSSLLNHDTVDNIICSQEYSSSQTLLTSPTVSQHRKDYRCEGSCDKAVNTCVSMATQEAEEERKAVEQARCFYFKPLPFAEESTRQWPGEDHSSPCAHVSILSFHVDDYRQQDNLQCPALTPPDREQTVADETTYTCCYNENLLSLNLELMSGHDGTSYANSNDQNKKLVLDLLLLRETKPAPEEHATVDAIKTDFTEVSEKVSELKDEDARDGAPMALHENSHSGPIIYNSCERDNPVISSTLTSHIVVDENLILETAKRLNDERKGKEMSVVEKKQAVLDLFCLRQSQDLDHTSPEISRSATDNPVSNTSDLGSCHVISSPQTCQSSDDKYLFARLFSGDFKESSSKENDCEEVHFEGHDKDVALGLNEEQDKEGKMLNETKEFEEAKKETEELIEETRNQSESSVNVKDQKAGRLFSRMFKTGSFRYSSVDEGIPFTTLTAANTNSRDDLVENLPSKEMVLRRFLLRDTREDMAQTVDGLTREEFTKDTNIPADAAPPQNEAVSERLSNETKDLCQMPSGDNCVEIESKGQKGDIQSTTGNEVCVDVDDDDLSYQGSFSDTCSELSVIFRGHNPSAKSFQVTKVPLTACVISDSHESPASRLLDGARKEGGFEGFRYGH